MASVFPCRTASFKYRSPGTTEATWWYETWQACSHVVPFHLIFEMSTNMLCCDQSYLLISHILLLRHGVFVCDHSDFRVIYGVPFSHLFTELQISAIEVHIGLSPIQLQISPIQLQISPIQLQISPIQLQISPIQL